MRTEKLLAIPFRKTQPILLAQALSQCIESEYHQSSDRYVRDLSLIDQLRDEATITNPEISLRLLDNMMKYFVQLSRLSRKFPDELAVEFTWFNTLGYANSVAVKSKSINFERCNVLYNIGALYSRIGSIQARDNEESIKKAYQYFQLSASSFSYLIDEVIPFLRSSPPIELDIHTLLTLRDIMLAQAQECFWWKATLSGLKNSIIAKLSIGVSYFYGESLNSARRSTTIKAEWINHISCKHLHFEAASQYRVSLECLEKNKYGEEVARLREALNACSNALMNTRFISANVLDDLHGLNSTLQREYTRAEKDNDLVYLQPVPSKADLPNIQASIMVKSSVNETLKDISGTESVMKYGEPLFNELKPFAVYQAYRLYQERREAYIQTNILSPIDILDNELRLVFKRLDLPGSLMAVEKPKGIPSSILTHSEELKSNDGLAVIEESIKDIQKLSTKSMELLDQSLELLRTEAKMDKEMRERKGTERWNRSSSETANKELLDHGKVLNNYLISSSKSDELVRNKYSEASELLQVLLSSESIEKYIPNSAHIQLSSAACQGINQLRDTLSAIRSIELNRKQHLEQLNWKRCNNDDIMPNLLKELVTIVYSTGTTDKSLDVALFEPVIKRQLITQYDDELAWVKAERDHQRQVCDELEVNNANFHLLVQNDESVMARQHSIQNLEVTFFKYQELISNLQEGKKFYNDLIVQLNKFSIRCNEFVHNRQLEFQLVEVQLDGETSVQKNSSQETSKLVDQSHESVIEDSLTEAKPVPGLWTPSTDIRFG
ncbi:BRO1-domain-containing protein [Nadsonia fulvescens var. elongata DSM 6958]|uniref:BRO1-domain-containing protein n=1 Tax=Nadsonia fulvescens var. elongata DSM 6958 TaxID=857566 RepID=A0A1E3PPH3_9ASCO|nr:BRO1-domain-containing protein [Nadsonia fulvescens var. elongata DSM 6958]